MWAHHRPPDQRGWQTTSTRAGSPRLTTSPPCAASDRARPDRYDRRPHAHALRQLRIINGWVVDNGANVGAVDATGVAIRYPLNMHQLLMIGAVVVHHGQQWDFVMHRRPQSAWAAHQLAIALEVHDKPPLRTMVSAAPTAAGALYPTP